MIGGIVVNSFLVIFINNTTIFEKSFPQTFCDLMSVGAIGGDPGADSVSHKNARQISHLKNHNHILPSPPPHPSPIDQDALPRHPHLKRQTNLKR